MPTIAALSFPVRRKSPIWEVDYDENLNAILKFAMERSPDLLVCAGFTLWNQSMVEALNDLMSKEFLGRTKRPGLIVEAHIGECLALVKNSNHEVFYICPAGKVIRIGPQIFVGSSDVIACLGVFGQAISKRILDFPHQYQYRICLLLCGEINVLQHSGGESIAITRQGTPFPLFQALTSPNTLYVNPVHDEMARIHHLEPKRRFLSSNGVGRSYLGVSNWNIAKKRDPGEKAHSFWFMGKEVRRSYGHQTAIFKYSEYNIP